MYIKCPFLSYMNKGINIGLGRCSGQKRQPWIFRAFVTCCPVCGFFGRGSCIICRLYCGFFQTSGLYGCEFVALVKVDLLGLNSCKDLYSPQKLSQFLKFMESNELLGFYAFFA
jgi:hypothetical protein